MLYALVIGKAIATIKHPSMEGQKLLVTQPLLADLMTADGDPVVAIDVVGADGGQYVLLTSDGKYARERLNVDATPVRWTVIGVADFTP